MQIIKLELGDLKPIIKELNYLRYHDYIIEFMRS
jgi:hypothetical protein